MSAWAARASTAVAEPMRSSKEAGIYHNGAGAAEAANPRPTATGSRPLVQTAVTSRSRRSRPSLADEDERTLARWYTALCGYDHVGNLSAWVAEGRATDRVRRLCCG